MNLLIALDGLQFNNYGLDGWSEAINYFGHRRLLYLTSVLLIIPTHSLDTSYEAVLNETIETFIDLETCNPNSEKITTTLTDRNRSKVIEYFRETVKALRPYLPDEESLTLVSTTMSLDQTILYLVVRYYPENEYPN